MNLFTVNKQKEIKNFEKNILTSFFTPTHSVELELSLGRNSVSVFFLYT